MDQRVLMSGVQVPPTHVMEEKGTNSGKLSFGCHVIALARACPL